MSQFISKYIQGPAVKEDPQPIPKLDKGRRANPPPARVKASDERRRRIAGTLVRIKSAEGYGFIQPDAGPPQYYAHISAMADRSFWVEGARVTFWPGEATPKSRRAPVAHNIRPEVAEKEEAQ